MVVWHASQALVVVMCVAVLPVAVVPLWQEAQVPVTFAWLKLAGVQALVVWQSEHCAVVAMWLLGLPAALVPLWQDEQVPVTWV